MYLIVGLGNPGDKYTFTYHNLGFLCIDYISQKFNISVNKLKHKALMGKGVINGEDVILAKPQTYMNLSGESVVELAQWYKIPSNRIIIVYDDIDLDIGKIRIKSESSHGGHNGVKSIISHLNTNNFPRVKVGIGQVNINIDLADYVLSRISKDKEKELFSSIEKASKSIEYIIGDNIQKAMNEFN